MAPDILQPPAYVLGLAFVASLITSAIKGPVEELLPPANKWHDLAFTLFPVALSLGLVLGYMATHGGDLFLGVVWGLLSGVGAIGSYLLHTRTGAAATTHAPTTGQDGPRRVITMPANATVQVTVPPPPVRERDVAPPPAGAVPAPPSPATPATGTPGVPPESATHD